MTTIKPYPGTLVKRSRAWLITWEWFHDHDKMPDEQKVIAILDSRVSERTIEPLIEQVYVSSLYTYYEQLAYTKDRRNRAPRIEPLTIAVDEEVQAKISAFPNRAPYGGAIMCGDSPLIYARLVDKIEAYVDEDGNEHLDWLEPEQIRMAVGGIKYNKTPRHWTRNTSAEE